MALEGTFALLAEYGVFDILLPFILIFTIVFAVMQKVKIFDDKRVNTMIALVMGLSTIVPHVLWGTPDPTDARLTSGIVDVVEVINNSLPNVSVIIVAVLMALIIIGVLGKRVELADNSLSGWIAFLSFIVIGYIFGNAAGWWNRPEWLYVLDNPDIVALIIVILVFAIIIWFVTKDEGDPNRISKEGFGDQFAKMLQGGK